MIYTVVWQPDALLMLADIWTAGPDRNAISRASDAIDRILRHDPSTKGEAREDDRRILICPPLAVFFRVEDLDRLVSVFDVWRW